VTASRVHHINGHQLGAGGRNTTVQVTQADRQPDRHQRQTGQNGGLHYGLRASDLRVAKSHYRVSATVDNRQFSSATPASASFRSRDE